MPAPSPPAARPQQGCACSSAKPGAAHERPVSYRPYRLGALAPGRLRGTDRSAGMVAPFESTAEARVSPIDISRIRIDGGTQSRANLNESVVAEYAEAMTEGAKLPAVTVFFDGSEYWLADGFHRYHGHKRIGALKIDAEVHNGTRRDAVLHSVGANAAHGLRRTNEDKRRAVETLLNDAEWSLWSDREIAKQCGVTHPFVAAVRNPDVAASRKINRSKPQPGVVTVTTPDEVVTVTASPEVVTVTTPSKVESDSTPAVPPGSVLIEQDRLDELNSGYTATLADNESMAKVFEADDRITVALAEAKRYREQNRVLEERIRGLMNEVNAAKRAAKSWQARFEKLEREVKKAANDGIDPAVGF